MPIESALQYALRRTPETDQISAEEIVEVAEMGRRHPQFDERMSRIARSPSSLSLYRAARETMPVSGLRKTVEGWMEGFKTLPQWLEQIMNGLQQVPSLAYRSAAAAPPTELQLTSPNPVNQSVYSSDQEWRTAGDPNSVLITVEGEADAGSSREVSVTVASRGDDWSLDNEATYRFKVLSEDEVSKANWATESAPDAPISAALVFCSLGLFAEAESLLARWPNDPTLEPFAELIRRACQARRADAREFYL